MYATRPYSVTAEQEAKVREQLATPEGREVQRIFIEGLLRGIARNMILRGAVDAATISLDELRTLAWQEFVDLRDTGELSLEAATDYSASILEDARKFAADGKVEYAFVFYGLYLEHLLNWAVRDGGIRCSLTKPEAIEIMKKSIYDKTGVMWVLLFGEPMPEELARDIRAVANLRNQFTHYKWAPDPDLYRTHDEVERQEREALGTAERAAEGLRRYIDELIAPAESDVFEWLTDSDSAAITALTEARSI
ncbi:MULTISPECIES: hypothetical protein [unclassified Microbacterium]|uniref:hypothetical protein n=1 Tax=unclassified Microbacterium TaxID=2609290 RepID=UPI0012F866AD|nr:hypothetical protein [Microbacterium sp. MAH-37]MVQ44113.1 hypothetical protein [Microbacterium sp. MAH-37]